MLNLTVKRKIEWNRFKRSSGRTVAHGGWTVLNWAGSLVGPTHNGFSLVCVSSEKLQLWPLAMRRENPVESFQMLPSS